jgi:hypothetical protein
LRKAEGEQEDDDRQRQNNFRLPDKAQRGLAENHSHGGIERERNPHDEKGNAINAGDGGNLDERNHLVLRRAEKIPRKAAEQPRANHFERDPGRRARERPQRPPCPIALADFSREEPDPDGGIEREVGGQRNPAENWKASHGHMQQPV